MTTAKRKPGWWVVAGGKPGEVGHCTRCGEGLRIELPQHVDVLVASMKAFTRVHLTCKDSGRTEERPMSPTEWLQGRDTGTSSLTIYSVVTGLPNPHGRYSPPRDPSDFGRCYRLLQLFPVWRSKMGRVAFLYPEWSPFVREWDKLTEMWETALKTNDGKAMYDFMKGLEKEGDAGE